MARTSPPGGEDHFIEELRSKKPRIRLTGSGPIPSLLGVGGNGDLLPHLKAHLKSFGDLVEIVPELVSGRRTVKSRIIAHRPEERLALVLILAILPEALSLKAALGVLPL